MSPRDLLREIQGVTLLGFGAFTLASIASFDVADLPSRVAPARGAPENLGGSLGALLSSELIGWVGTLGAYGAAGMVLLFAASSLRRDRAPAADAPAAPEPARSEPLRRVVGALVIVATLAVVERVLAGSPWGWLVERGLPPGGIWGLLLEHEATRLMGGFGAPLCAGLVLGIGLMLLTDRPLRELLRKPVEGAQGIADAAKDAAVRAEDALAVVAPAAPAADDAPAAPVVVAPASAEPVIIDDEPERDLDEGDDAGAAAPTPAPALRAMPAGRHEAADDDEDVDDSSELVRPVPAPRARAGEDASSTAATALPSVDLLAPPEAPKEARAARDDRGRLIEDTLAQFKVQAKVVSVEHGPSVALFALELGRGVKVQRVASLLDNLALTLRVPGIRLQAPIPGTSWVGLEVPNEEQEVVRLRELVENPAWRKKDPALPIFLGKDSAGRPLIADLAKMPHLLIAGATGSGKSVCINSIIVSLLLTRTPREVQLILIDPKQVEMTQFAKVPHLAAPVVTDMRKAGAVLEWAVKKMEERYGWLAKAGVRHIREYNELGKLALADRHGVAPAELERRKIPWKLPYVVLVVDELNDLMMIAQKEVEASITRLAQKSRAVGIHVVLATQRPSVDVITGVIKSNLPARIAFRVTAKVDSRTILDASGADKLLGMGDMLFLPPGRGQPMRALGALVTDDEVNAVVKAWSKQGKAEYEEDLIQHAEAAARRGKGSSSGASSDGDDGAGDASDDRRDPVYEDAVRVILSEGRGSVSLIQRKLELGYGRAARLLDLMAEDGLVGPANGSKPREVKLSLDQWESRRRQAA